MKTLRNLLARQLPPVPWEEGENLPWDEPEFSGRMLREHLSQEHDLASRRSSRIESHGGWIEQTPLGGRRGRVLDLGCGPGLYLNRLARRGHRGVGIDFSPASIEHARTEATAERLDVRYVEADIRSADFGTAFDVVMLLYGQLNVFRRAEAASIVRRAFDALAPGGIFVTEPQRCGSVKRVGESDPSWSTGPAGLFSDRPHLLLTERFWNETARTTTERFLVVDVADADVISHAFTTAAYTDREIVDLLAGAGFDDVRLEPSLAGEEEPDEFLVVVMGRKPIPEGKQP